VISAAAETRGQDLLAGAIAGDVASVSQLISALESDGEVGRGIRTDLHAAGGRAHVIGITGAPGSGKSTLVGAIAGVLRARGLRVGIIAVDPSSSISGGAILGDRIRMQQHVLDPGIYLRSMSSRGWLGGVSRATVDAVAVLDAAGWDVVFVETVGVGQAEVEIVGIAQTVAVVSVPGLGDDIQAIKAGLLEVADIHVVNKEDRPDANKTIAELVNMLNLVELDPDGWAVPVHGTVATTGAGVERLADLFGEHRDWLVESGRLQQREARAARSRINAIAKDIVVDRLYDLEFRHELDSAVDRVVAREVDPYSAAQTLIRRVAGE
jgi:LAO/AO transport system kinase